MSISGTQPSGDRCGIQAGVGMAGNTLPVLTQTVAEHWQASGASRTCQVPVGLLDGSVSQHPRPPRAWVASQQGFGALDDGVEQQQRPAPLQHERDAATGSGFLATRRGTGMPRLTTTYATSTTAAVHRRRWGNQCRLRSRGIAGASRVGILRDWRLCYGRAFRRSRG